MFKKLFAAMLSGLLLVAGGQPVMAETTKTFPATDGLLTLTPDQQQALDQYRQQDYASARDLRFEKAAEYGLENDIDADGFLTMDFINSHGTDCTSGDGLIILNPLAKNSATTFNLAARNQGTVNGYTFHVWNFPGGYMSMAVWHANLKGFGDVDAFCANGYYASPMPGTPVESVSLSDNVNLRKALYYGYNGPENRMGSYGWDTDMQVCLTNELVSYAVTGNCVSKNLGTGNLWRNYTLRFWNDMQTWPEPGKNFQAYIGDTRGSGTNFEGNVVPVQPIAFGKVSSEGSFQLSKKSDDPAVDVYSVAGAQYTIYNDKKEAVKKLTIGADGKSEVAVLPFGTYTCQETKAPAGFMLDPAVHTFTISQAQPDASGNLNMHQLNVTDSPAYAKAGLLIHKQDEKDKPLADAHFAVRYYKKGSKDPARSWILKSDKKGEVRLDDDHKVSGDPFYTNAKGEVILPAGSLKVEETKAPAGYKPTDKVWTIQLEQDGTDKPVAYKPVAITNEAYELVLTKKQTGTDITIPGTRFEHTDPVGNKETLVTDKKGQLTIRPLMDGRHKLTETAPLPGYQTMEPLEFEVENGKADLKEMTLWNTPEAMKLSLIKTDPLNKPLAGAVFGLYEDEACEKEIATYTTDEKGSIVFDNIQDRTTYWLKELEAPRGYRLPEETVISLRMETEPAHNTGCLIVNEKVYEAGEKDSMAGAEMKDGILTGAIHRINRAETPLPEAGGPGLLGIGAAGIACLMLGKKKNQK